MARVRQAGTTPELKVREALTAIGARYRLNVRSLPGSPDIANKSRRKAIFVHGCFWHRHDGCARATTPKTRTEHWKYKFERNVRRDRAKEAALLDLGFDVLTIWECEASHMEDLVERLGRYWWT